MARAIAFPIPREEPVTRAFLFANRIISKFKTHA
jgi:hypothetical protein